jgi:N6-adenosine-specific RNA methylase IME4
MAKMAKRCSDTPPEQIQIDFETSTKFEDERFLKMYNPSSDSMNASDDLISSVRGKFGTILADPPWQFQNSTGKIAPEHKRLTRYATMKLPEIKELPVSMYAADSAHLYLWVPNALLQEGLDVMKAWGFTYKANFTWYKIRKDGGPDGRGVGFYFRNVTELILFGVRGKNARTLKAGRTQVNLIATRKREHSRKPDEIFRIIEACSRGPFLELFAREKRKGWTVWGNQAPVAEETFTGPTHGRAYCAEDAAA